HVTSLMRLVDALETNVRLEGEAHRQMTRALFSSLVASESASAVGGSWHKIRGRFDFLLDRPIAVEDLDQVILELAVRGFFAQRTDDRASVVKLLGRCREEQARYATTRNVALPKLEPIEKSSLPFSIPPNWTWA